MASIPVVSRRRFLESGVALAGLIAGGRASAQPEGKQMARDGVQLYWFSQLAAENGKSAQETFPDDLALVAEAGFSNIEGNLDFCATDESTGTLDERLKALGLGLAGLYAGGALHEEDAARDVATILDQAPRAKALGCPGVTCNPNPIGREKTDAELANQAAALNDIGAGLAELGLFFGVHTHAPEMSHNAREFRYNLDRTNPQHVGLCADFHWMYRGGGNPYSLTEQYASRINSTHLRNSEEAVWSEAFGAGDVDYALIREMLDGVAYEGPLTVELALEPRTPRTREPLECLKASREYLREVFGV